MRPVIYTVWIVLSGLAVLLFTQSAKELAPTEDQGIVFGIVNTPANSTLDQMVPYTEAAQAAFESVEEYDYSFQITFPAGGFGGMIVKPWGDRKRTIFEIQPEVGQKLGAIPGIQMFPVLPPALPGGGSFPVEFVLASTADASEILRVRAAAPDQGGAERHVCLSAPDRREDRPAPDRGDDRSRPGGRTRAQPAAGGR